MLDLVIITITGLTCGAILAVAARVFAVYEDPRIAKLTELLPGYNCGSCGFGGCSEYAKAVVTAGESPSLCAPGGPDTSAKVAHFMGLDAAPGERQVAIVLCGGDAGRAPRRFAYNGVADCTAAHGVGGGDKRCRYGCLGYGSCSRVCPVGAIEIVNGLALIHPDLCIGCRACLRTCPRQIIRMAPVSRSIHVLCSSRDKGPDVKKACSVGCIACRVCTKLAENEAIAMDGFLAVVNYDKPLDNQQVVEKCPGHCIIRRPLNAPLAEPAPAAAQEAA